jgi:predicted transposase/invertase (TIGR01784 family)
MQLRTGEEYPALCDVVGVTICNFELWPERDAGGRNKVPMLSRWRMQEQHSGEVGLPQVQYVFLELPKYAAGDQPQTLIDKWAYFFREAKNLEVVPPALSEEPFRGALETARTSTFSAEEWEAYDRAKMAEQDARGALAVAHEEGHKSGLAEGHKSGLAEGHKSGLAEGKRDSLRRIMELRGIALTEAEQDRISHCSDLGRLDRWLAKALTASAASDALA